VCEANALSQRHSRAAVGGFNVYCANNNDCNLLTCESKNLGMSSILIFIVSYAPSGLAESASRCILAKTLHIG